MAGTEDHPALSVDFTSGQTICFRYTNWQGVAAIRTARVIRLIYGSTDWHPKPQWLLEAVDVEKDAVRQFALRDMEPAD